MKKLILLAALLASSLVSPAQVFWDLAGNGTITPGTDFLGTTGSDPLDIRTEDIQRFRLLPDATYNIGAFVGMTTNGFGLLSPDVAQFYTNSGPGPFSLLHLADADNNAQSLGYRPWMRVGVNFTGNADQGYVGHKYAYADPTDYTSNEKEDHTDLVIHWEDEGVIRPRSDG